MSEMAIAKQHLRKSNTLGVLTTQVYFKDLHNT